MVKLQHSLPEMDKYIQEEHERRLKSAEQSLERDKKYLESSYLFMQEALSAGLSLDMSDLWGKWQLLQPTFPVKNPEDWRIIHQLVGKLRQSYVEPDTRDARTQTVKVHLVPEDSKFANITFTFIKKLPKKGKCRLKRVNTSSLVMVCE